MPFPLSSPFPISLDRWGLWAACLLLVSSISGAAGIAPGTIDSQFRAKISLKSTLNRAVPLPDRRILVIGGFAKVDEVSQSRLARLNPDGTLDTTFRPMVDGSIYACVVLADGKILIGGAFTTVGGVECDRIARLNPDGTPDVTFVAAADGVVNGMLPLADGKTLIAGNFTQINGFNHPYLARLNEDGSLDGTLNVSMDASPSGIARHSDGRFYLSGVFSTVNGVPRPYVARLFEDGSLDPTFTPLLDGTVASVITQPNGATLLAGQFTTVNGVSRKGLARISADGTLDASFVPPALTNYTLGYSVASVALQTDGKILFCGSFAKVYSNVRNDLVRLLPDGSIDSKFVPTEYFNINFSVFLQGDGSILAGGVAPPFGMSTQLTNPTRMSNDAATDILSAARTDRVEWLRGGAAPEVSMASFELSTDGGQTWTSLGAGERISGGWELTGLSLPAAGILRARGRQENGSNCSSMLETICAFGLGAPSPQPHIAIQDQDGNDLTKGTGTVRLSASHAPATFTLRNLGDAPLDIRSIVSSETEQQAFSVDQSGMLTRLPAGEETQFAVTLNPYGPYEHRVQLSVVSNDPSENPFAINLAGPGALNSHTTPSAMSLGYQKLDGYGEDYWVSNPTYPPVNPADVSYQYPFPANVGRATLQLYYNWYGTRPTVTVDGLPSNSYGGELPEFRAATHLYEIKFTAADGTTRTFYLSASRPSPQPGDMDWDFNAGISGQTTIDSALLLPDGGSLFNVSTGIQGFAAKGLAKLKMDGTVDPAFTPSISSLIGAAVAPDGQIYAFGDLFIINGKVQNNLARLTPEGILDMTFRPVINGSVRALALQDDGKVLIGGGFTNVNGSPIGGLARLNPDGSLDPMITGVPNGEVNSLGIQPDGKIIVGGSFDLGSAKWLIRLNADGSRDFTFSATGVTTTVNSLALQPDGSIFAGGGDLVRLLPNGSLDPSWNYRAIATSYCPRTDGKLMVSVFDTYLRRSKTVLRVTGTGVDGAFNCDRGGAGSFDVYGLMLAADGSPYAFGSFTNWANFSDCGLVRLHGDTVPAAAPSPPSVPSPAELRWQQASDGAPAAERVLFQYRRDESSTWQAVGSGRYVGDGWVLSGLDLPRSGQVRALAYVRSGYNNTCQGLMPSRIQELDFTAPGITVQNSEGTDLVNGESKMSFGSVGLRATTEITLTILSSGESHLKLGQPTITGKHASMFAVTSPVDPVVVGSTALTVRFTPTAIGEKTATLSLPSNDALVPDFEIVLTGNCIAAVAPIVRTLPAQVTGATTATLRGSIDAKGSDRLAFFDWGLTTKYGMTIGSTDGAPATIGSSGPTEFQAPLTGLLPHTRYHCRLRAAGPLGGATGADASFTTANRSPVAASDSLAFLRGITKTVDLVGNDSDPDGDPLKLLSINPPPASSHVRVTKSGNLASIAFGAAAPDSVTFTYKVSDGFGGVATGEVTVAAAAPGSVSPSLLSFDSLAATRSVNLTVPASVHWMAKPSASWVTCALPGGTGSHSISISVGANSAKASRSAFIDFGGGVRLSVNQSGAALPELTTPFDVPSGILTRYYSLRILTTNFPVTYTAIGLPPGLKIDASGEIGGYPTRAGSYPVRISARNGAGTAVNVAKFTIPILPLRDGFAGNWHGFIGSSSTLDNSAQFLRSRFEMTVSSTGALSGKIYVGMTSRAFKGSLWDDLSKGLVSIDVPYPAKEISQVTFYLDPTTGLATGFWSGASVTAWRQVWRAGVNPAIIYKGQHCLVLSPPNKFPGLPQGYGYATFTVDEKTGSYQLAGKLATGESILTSSFVGPSGQVLLYQSLYKDLGSFGGVAALDVSHRITGTATWYKPAATPTDKTTVYRDGFLPVPYSVSGSALPVVPPGGVLCGLANEDDNAMLTFDRGGLELNDSGFYVRCSLRNPDSTGLTNIATFPEVNVNSVKLTLISPATGIFAGEFILPAANGQPARKALFSGLVLPSSIPVSNPQIRGYGHFLLPQASADPSSAPVWSGSVVLGKNTRH